MPTQGHDIAQKWVINSVVDWKDEGIISKEEWEGLKIGFGTTLKLPTSSFSKSQKEPDIYIRPFGSDSGFLPPVAFEVGWSESASRLRENVRILLEGGAGHIQVVIVIDWYLQKDGLTVTGKADLWRRGSDGHPVHEQSEVCLKHLYRYSMIFSSLGIYGLTSPRIFTLFQGYFEANLNVSELLLTTYS